MARFELGPGTSGAVSATVVNPDSLRGPCFLFLKRSVLKSRLVGVLNTTHLPGDLSKQVGASTPTFSNGFPGRRGPFRPPKTTDFCTFYFQTPGPLGRGPLRAPKQTMGHPLARPELGQGTSGAVSVYISDRRKPRKPQRSLFYYFHCNRY